MPSKKFVLKQFRKITTNIENQRSQAIRLVAMEIIALAIPITPRMNVNIKYKKLNKKNNIITKTRYKAGGNLRGSFSIEKLPDGNYDLINNAYYAEYVHDIPEYNDINWTTAGTNSQFIPITIRKHKKDLEEIFNNHLVKRFKL